MSTSQLRFSWESLENFISAESYWFLVKSLRSDSPRRSHWDSPWDRIEILLGDRIEILLGDLV